MPSFFLSLELDNSGIKAQIIRQSNTQALIKGHCHVVYEDLPDFEEIKDFFDAGMDMVSQQLDLGLCSTAIIFLSPLSVSFRNIDLPFSSEKKIKQILPFELEATLPYGNKKHVSDFHRLNLEDNSNLILTASILESDIEIYFSTLDRYDIKPVIITHQVYAAAVNFLENSTYVSSFIFIHIAGHICTLVLVKNRKPCMVRVFNIVPNDPETIVTSVNQTLIGFEQRTGLLTVFDIFICCEENSKDIDSICDALKGSKELKSRLRTIEPEPQKTRTQMKINGALLLSGVVPDKRIKYLFNFCKGKYGPSSFFKRHFNHVAIVFILAFFVFILAIINIKMDILNLETQIATIDHRSVSIFKSTFPEKKKIQDSYLQMKANVQEIIKKSGASGDKDQPVRIKGMTLVEIMSEISLKIEASTDMEISRFIYNSGRIILTGSTGNFNNVDNIKSKIESSDLFEKVSISSAAADKKGDKVNFKFVIEM